jgi:nitroreductase
MRSSILEIAQSITTWPQLASAVTYGGGMTADICRRILLDQYRGSGRYIVDIADLVNDEVAPLRKKEIEFEIPPASSGRDFGALIQTGQQGVELPEAIMSKIVEAACMAPSGGNSQPWKWIYRNRALHLFHEIDLSTQWLDYKNRGSHISFGAALENLELEAIHQGYEVNIDLVPEEDSLLVATIVFSPISDAYLSAHQQRFEHFYPLMRKRITNRYMGNESPINPEALENLKVVASEIQGARLSIINNRDDLLTMAKVVGVSDKLLLTNEVSHQEFFKEIKWSKDEAEKARVGIDVRTVELSASELAGFNVAKSWNAVKNLVKWGGGSVFERLGTKMTKSSSALALLTMPEYSRKDFIEGGRALQRVWMEANAVGICVQPMSAAIFLWARLVHGNGDGLTEKMARDLREIREQHLRLFNTPNDAGEVFLFRLFYAGEPKVLSLRKKLSDVFDYEG